MGSGKSTVLRKLRSDKSMNNFRFVDLDQYIYQQFCEQAESLAQLILKIGFPKFRELEVQALRTLSKSDHLVVALGGGALNEETSKIFGESSWSGHWLNTDFELCLQRIHAEGEARPLASKSDKELEALYIERSSNYSQYPGFKSHSQLIEIMRGK